MAVCKTCLITGATSGIGRAAAMELAQDGFDLILTGRNRRRGEAVCEAIRRQRPDARAVFHPCDISSLNAVRGLADRVVENHPVIDVLINNAGLRIDTYQQSADGIELTFATNHLGHFLLTRLLLPQLRAAPAARIITVSSSAHAAAQPPIQWVLHREEYDRRRAYAQSKLANILFTAELARRLEGTRIAAYAIHPGIAASGFAGNNGILPRLKHLAAHAMRGELITARRAADGLVFLATSANPGPSGAYYHGCRSATPSHNAQDPNLAEDLWSASLRLCDQ